MSGARRGTVIAAIWLIGLGVVLLVRQATGLPWASAWPMFLILVGVASFLTTLLTWRPSLGGLWDFTGSIAWIAIGAVLLASTTGGLGVGPSELIATWWPWVAIGLGVWCLIGAFVPTPVPASQPSADGS